MPLSEGLVGFVALRCYAEECVFTLSTHAQDHETTFGTSLSTSESNRRTAQSARRPEGQAASEIFCGHTALFVCARALSLA